MFVHPDLHLNKLEETLVPSGRDLFERYGWSAPQGHPDNTDPKHFNIPVNASPSALEKLQSIQTTTRYNMRLEERELAESLDSAGVEYVAPETKVKDDERSEED